MNVYIIRNKEGFYFRAKGYSGSGETWVEDINKARIYAKLGLARSQVSYFYNNFPQFGIPDIISFELKDGIILQESDRVEKQKINKNKLKLKRELSHKKWQKNYLEEQIAQAQEKLKNL